MSSRDIESLTLIIDAAFDKIDVKLSKIFQNEENRRQCARRWIWELMQNARDYRNNNTAVKINISFNEAKNTVSFSHDGKYFNNESLTRLITQISGKIEEDDNSGRFGSGFISTHLLSKKIKIQGAYKKKNDELVKLIFDLDRSAWEEKGDPREYFYALKNQIHEGVKNVDILEQSNEPPSFDAKTCFIYPLEDKCALENARIGLLDLERQLPLVLAFNTEIHCVTVNNDTYKILDLGQKTEYTSIKLSQFQIFKNNMPIHEILVISDIDFNIQISFFVKDKKFISYNDQTSRLFCRFPLIGTESFSLPFVLNSELFEVTDSRDGLRDEHPKNQEILNAALILYNKSLDYFINHNYQCYQHICKMVNSRFMLAAKKEQLHTSVMEIYSRKDFVKTNRGNTLSLKNIRIPVISDNEYPKIISDNEKKALFKCFYELVNKCPFFEIPIFHDCRDWAEVLHKRHFTVENLCDMVSKELTDDGDNLLQILMKNEVDEIKWLNEYIRLLNSLDKIILLKNKKIYLNQSNHIIAADEGSIDNINDIKLKEIYNMFFHHNGKSSIENKLFLKDINLSYKGISKFLETKNDLDVAKEISNKVHEFLTLPKGEDGKREKHVQDALNKLFYWMNTNETMAEKLFSTIYTNRMNLCSSNEQLEHY